MKVCKLKISLQFGELFPNSHRERHEQSKFMGTPSTLFKPERADQKNLFLLALFFAAARGSDHRVHHPKILRA